MAQRGDVCVMYGSVGVMYVSCMGQFSSEMIWESEVM